MKTPKIFSIVGIVLVLSMIFNVAVFHIPVNTRLVASILTVTGVILASRFLKSEQPEGINMEEDKV